MCKTLHCTMLLISLCYGVVNQMNATTSFLPTRLFVESYPPRVCRMDTSHWEEKGAPSIRFPNPSLLDSIETFLEIATTPYHLSPIPYLFIDQLKTRATESLIRNGDLDVLVKTYRLYQNDLAALRVFAKTHQVSLDAKRKELCAVKKGHICDWGDFRKLRKQLSKSFESFRLALLAAYHTERILWAQYQHNPSLYHAINSLVNLNQQPLPVYVQTRTPLFHDDPGLQHLEGMLVVSLKEGIFSSDTPFIRKYHPRFVGRSGAIAIFVDSEADGATLSHEFGHLYYLYHHWESYMKFIVQQGEHYQIGGHGAGDCSGKAADLAEAGKMPNLFMPWAYRKRWSESHQPLITLGDE